MKIRIKINEALPLVFWKNVIGSLMLLTMLMMTVKPVMAEVVNINKANAEALQQNLQGVGAVKSKSIVDYRKKNGPFKSLDDLKDVPGMGEELIKKNKKNMSTTRGLSKAKAVKEKNKAKRASNEKSKNDANDELDKKSKKNKESKKDKKENKFKKDKKDKKDKKVKKNKKDKKDKKDKKVKKVKNKKDKKDKKDKKVKNKKDKKDKKNKNKNGKKDKK